ncbi:SAM-dependent methyltransferase [Flagellimonas algicola]|uniref:Methyltransferase domain-containing protein n=1 Tax=Flagellimonas algicola TaxID=2583815 RepID=A0ABY2WRI8_9FLAO|nr:class I SAM-dependent methyltransferase [Allomuricauda algicola]TMU57617.1 methyltransferase domain-containing protein [Allomuricauda algicola]
MKTTTLKPVNIVIPKSKRKKTDLVEFYNEATADYEFWSKDFNMHFGYWKPFATNFFRRDTMLNELNNQVLKRLNLKKEKALFVDLGCGMGGTMRYALQKNNHLTAMGVTLSETQVSEGNKFLKNHAGVILKENYNHTSFKSNSVDGAIAIESFCHSGHHSNTFKEAYRILKPKGKLVISDAFLKKNVATLDVSSRYCYQQLCDSWSLERLGAVNEVVNQLKNVGFKDVLVEDISMRVAPSVLHVPFAILGFTLRQLFKSGTLRGQSINNLKGSLFSLLSGLH